MGGYTGYLLDMVLFVSGRYERLPRQNTGGARCIKDFGDDGRGKVRSLTLNYYGYKDTSKSLENITLYFSLTT